MSICDCNMLQGECAMSFDPLVVMHWKKKGDKNALFQSHVYRFSFLLLFLFESLVKPFFSPLSLCDLDTLSNILTNIKEIIKNDQVIK